MDKFASIKQNGPPPSAARNVKILYAALKVMFKDNFAKQFTHFWKFQCNIKGSFKNDKWH